MFSILCLLVAVRQKLHVNAYKDELGIILQEASAVKEELESIMNNTVELSRNVTDDIDCRLQEYRDASVLYSAAVALPPAAPVHSALPPSRDDIHQRVPAVLEEPARRRVYEVARDLNVSCRELLDRLKNEGVPVKNHLSLIEPEDLQMAGYSLDSPPVAAGLRQVPNPGPETNGGDVAASARTMPERPAFTPDSRSDEFVLEDLKQAHPYIAVRTLHERGYAVWEIAKMLGRGQGEINLILNITRKKQVQSL